MYIRIICPIKAYLVLGRRGSLLLHSVPLKPTWYWVEGITYYSTQTVDTESWQPFNRRALANQRDSREAFSRLQCLMYCCAAEPRDDSKSIRIRLYSSKYTSRLSPSIYGTNGISGLTFSRHVCNMYVVFIGRTYGMICTVPNLK